MDLATKLFSLSFGVEPNKATLKDFSDILNSAVLSLSEKQKAISEYAETAQTQTYVAAANQPGQIQQVQKPTKPQVKWAIPEEKMKELLWKRAQLLQFERAKAAREKTSQANGSTGKTKPRGPPPKLGKPKSALEKGTQGQANGVKPKASQTKPPQTKPSPSKSSQTPKAPDTPKPKPASNQAAKSKPKPAPINTKPQPQAQGQPGKTANGKPAPK